MRTHPASDRRRDEELKHAHKIHESQISFVEIRGTYLRTIRAGSCVCHGQKTRLGVTDFEVLILTESQTHPNAGQRGL